MLYVGVVLPRNGDGVLPLYLLPRFAIVCVPFVPKLCFDSGERKMSRSQCPRPSLLLFQLLEFVENPLTRSLTRLLFRFVFFVLVVFLSLLQPSQVRAWSNGLYDRGITLNELSCPVFTVLLYITPLYLILIKLL